MVASPVPSFCPHQFHQNSTGRPLTTSLEVPEPEGKKMSTSFVEVQPPEKKPQKPPVCPPPPTKKARFPTSQAVTSLQSRTFSKV
ncbi:hypothetical protein AVEN_170804-1 [Araneus ventricosus]|uniref:Uncharacterized protein n=1 Tax=Araneus ventricosus TaxID=182803 RepID=A0A4Y2VED1_ARAVE|nr:hypothetical protein AVEN_170804-1 [Araneus ventricosus]